MCTNFSNIELSKYETSIESIQNASKVIASISSTAIEAHIISKSSIVYSPFNDIRFESEPIKNICRILKEKSQVFDFIDSDNLKNRFPSEIDKYLCIDNKNPAEILSIYAKQISISSTKYIKKNQAEKLFALNISLKNILEESFTY